MADEETISEAIVRRIDEGWDKEKADETRPYIGASMVGSTCDALLALTLRRYPENDTIPRVRRIFRDGHRIEYDVVKDLKRARLHVQERDPQTGRQHRFTSHGGHVRGHADGILYMEDEGSAPLLLEIKSMNKDLFNKLKKKGVKISHPKYFAQMTLMMGMGNLKKALLLAYCKDNSEYHAEEVDFDLFAYNYLIERIDRVFRGEERKISDREDSFACRFCFKRDACWGHKEPDRECHSCAHARPTTDGSWWCDKHDRHAGQLCDQWEKYTPKPKS
jgi:hypothetical protein